MRRLLDKVLERLLVLLMAVLVLDVLWQVFSRFALRAPSSFTDELARFLFIWIGLLGAAYVTGQRLHLAIDLLAERLSAKSARRLDKIVQLAVLLFALAVLVVGGGRLVYITFTFNQISPTLQIPLGYVYSVVPLSGLLIAFYAIADLVRPGPGPRAAFAQEQTGA